MLLILFVMERTTLVFNLNWRNALKHYPPEIRLEIYEGAIDYASTGVVPELSQLAEIAFQFIKIEIDKNNEKFDKKIEARKNAGSKGGKKRSENQKSIAKDSKKDFANNSKQGEARIANVAESEILDENNENEIIEPNGSNENQEKTLSESEKEIFEEYVNTLTNDVEYGIWREEIMMKYGIKNFKQAFKDFNCYLIGSTLDSQVKNIEDYKRIFFYNTSKFLSNEAKILAPIPNCQEIKRNGKRYVLQYGEEILLPDNAPPLPTDSLNYYWCTSWNQWRKTY